MVPLPLCAQPVLTHAPEDAETSEAENNDLHGEVD